MNLKTILLFLVLALVTSQNVYKAEAKGVIKGNIQKVWETIGKFDKIEWWQIPFRVEGPRGIGQIRYQDIRFFPTLKDVQILEEPFAYGYSATGFPGMKNIKARFEVKPKGEQTELIWSCEFEVVIPGTQGAMAGVIRRVWGGIIEKAQQLFN
jgi:carbon monoxide dehydrogenase subunit G